MKKLMIFLHLFALACPVLQAQEDTLPPLEQAAKEQQKSISQLVYSLKEVRKAICPPGENPPEESPFKDDQDFKHERAEQRLQELAQQQKAIIEQLKEQLSGDGSPQELAGDQQQISDALRKLTENPSIASDLRQTIKDARASSDDTTAAMKAEGVTESQVGAQKTLAKIEDALKQLQRNAEESAEKALDKAEEKLAEAEQDRQNNEGEMAGQKAGEAQKILKEAAEEQKRSGSESKRKMLEELAKQIEESELPEALAESPQDPATVQKLEEIRDAIAKARQGDRTARDELERVVQELKDLQQEMKYRARHAPETTDEQVDTILKDSGRLARRIDRAQEQLEGQKPGESECENPAPGSKEGQGQGQSASTTPDGHDFVAQEQNQPAGGQGSRGFIETDRQDIQTLANRWSGRDPDGQLREVILKELIDVTDRILIRAQQRLDALEKETVVRNLGKEEVPEKYKDDVATYFEQLSNPETK